MKRLALPAVQAATRKLRAVGVSRAGAGLPGFFALKLAGATQGVWTLAGGAQFAEMGERLYRASDSPDFPYFEPLSGEWKTDNWPRGSIETLMKRDSTPIRRDGGLIHRGVGENREWLLQGGYVRTLPDYVPAGGIPALPFAVWALRAAALPDGADAASLVTELQTALRLNDDEFNAIFARGGWAAPDPLWAEEDWADDALTDVLPAHPAAAAAPPIARAAGAGEALFDDVFAVPEDAELVANLVRLLRHEELFEVSEELVRNLLYSLRVDRIAVLVGKPGTGKTELVRAFSKCLERASGTTVHLVETPITEETAEFDLIGYRDLTGNYVPSRTMQEMNRANTESDLYVLLLDEFNLATIDAYGAKIISGITNRLAIDLPGSRPAEEAARWYPASGRWMPHNGLLVIGTMNSYLEDPSRKQLSVPIKRRTNLITMPDPVLTLVQDAGGADEPPQAFADFCRMLLDQAVRRLRVRGTSVIDGALLEELAAPVPDDALGLLWRLACRLAVHDEVPMTAGLIQSILRYIQTSDFAETGTGMDLQVEQKVLPVLRGPESLLDEVVRALGPGDWPRTNATIERMRALATSNAGRIRPLQ